jgi:hypothetical protein
MRAPVYTAVAIGFGLLVLIGYLVPAGLAGADLIYQIRSVLVGWAVILAAVAALVGVINLVLTHMGRISTKKNPDYYSIIVVVAFFLTVGLGIFEFGFQTDKPQFQEMVLSIQIPVESTLMGILAVTLTFASVRIFTRRKGLMASVFIISALIFLLIGSGLTAPLKSIGAVGWLFDFLQFLPIAGGRGILIGIALGSLTAGLRVLIGSDRPYSG